MRALQGAMARTGLPWKVRCAAQGAARARRCWRASARSARPARRSSSASTSARRARSSTAWRTACRPSEISYTGTNVSDRDLDVILAHGVHMNLDLISQIHRYGRRAPRRHDRAAREPARQRRPTPTSGISYYSGDKPTKFGIYPERLDEALAVARDYDLTVDTIHFHVSHHLLDDDLPAFDEPSARSAAMVRRAIDAGCPHPRGQRRRRPRRRDAAGTAAARPRRVCGILAEHFGPLGVTIACEPGEFFSRTPPCCSPRWSRSRTAAGPATAAPSSPASPAAGTSCTCASSTTSPSRRVLCRAADAPRTARYTLTSHINEGPDIFAEDYPLPPLEEGDIVAMLGVGAYCQANWHPHCLRPFPRSLVRRARLTQTEETRTAPHRDERDSHPNRGTLGQPPMGGGDHLPLRRQLHENGRGSPRLAAPVPTQPRCDPARSPRSCVIYLKATLA